MKTVSITRTYQNNKQSLGLCEIRNESNMVIFSALSLERGWLDNKQNISCIPKGNYTVVLEYSNAFKRDLWEIKNVPNRSECKFHSANYWYQLQGCIALGNSLKDIDKDGFIDILNSSNTMGLFHRALDGEKRFNLIVK